MLYRRDMVLQDAELNLSPALLANYAFELSKTYNKFYHDCPIMREEDARMRAFRLKLSEKTGEWIRESLALLGIEMPEKM
jgi:arginyl-tRNA synthetase